MTVAVVRAALILFLLFATCCVRGNETHVWEPYPAPRATLSLLGDVDFTTTERHWVEEAAKNLAVQTNGYISVTVDWSLNYNDDDSLRAALNRDRIVKIDTQAEPVQLFDAAHCCLLGLTHRSDLLEKATTIYLVRDRIEQIAEGETLPVGDTHHLFVSVAMHEMLHALGLNHVDDKYALMAPSSGYGAPTVMSRSDYVELCRQTACNISRVSEGRF